MPFSSRLFSRIGKVVGLGVVVASGAINSMLFNVDGDHHAFIFDRFQEVKSDIIGEGRHLKILWLNKLNQKANITMSQSLTDIQQNNQPQALLSSSQQQLVLRIKNLLTKVQIELDLAKQDSLLLSETIHRIEQIFLFVVVGEFNSGKSQFINTLLNEKGLCPTGVLPTTDRINILKYGEKREKKVEANDIDAFYIKNDLLKNTELVDTPGTNAILRTHQQITEHFVPRSDLILFVTSVDQPFSESQRAFLEKIHTWKKKVIIILNKIDQKQSENERNQIINFVKENVKAVLQIPTDEIKIFPISALHNLGIKELERYIRYELKAENKIEIKLQNPLGICEKVLNHHSDALLSRQTILDKKLESLNLLEDDVNNYRADMLRDFEFQLNKVDNLFLQMLDDNNKFFSKNMYLTKLIGILFTGTGDLKSLYDGEVNKSIRQDINEYISTLCDWWIEKTNRTIHQLIRHLSAMRVTDTSGDLEFTLSRQAILAQLLNQCQAVLSDKDQGITTQAEQLSENIDGARKLVGVGEGILGTIASGLTYLSMLDTTGILYLGAGAIFVAGAFLTTTKSTNQNEARARITNTRIRLSEVLKKYFTDELDSIIRKVTQQYIQPFERSARDEQKKLPEIKEKVELIQREIQQLRLDIKQLLSK